MADLLNNSIPGLRYGQKILPSEILGATGSIYGNTYYVDPTNGSDLNPGTSPDKAYASIETAYDSMTTNNDDVVILRSYESLQLTGQLTISKSRVHFIGDPYGRLYGQRTKINYADGIATALPFAVKNIGVGNTFDGIKFINNNTDAQVVGTVGEGGEYALYRNCEFYNSTNLDSDTVAELVLGGDSPQFINCTFGSLADAVSGNKVRPAVLVDGSVVTGGAGTTRDAYFDGCRF
jgi:hypothetical protein